MTHLVLKIRIMASWIQTSSIVSHDHQIISLLTDALKGQTRGRYVQSDKVEFARVLLSISLSLPFSLSLSRSLSLSLSLSLSYSLSLSLSMSLSLSLTLSVFLSLTLSLSLSPSLSLSLTHSHSLSLSLSLYHHAVEARLFEGGTLGNGIGLATSESSNPNQVHNTICL